MIIVLQFLWPALIVSPPGGQSHPPTSHLAVNTPPPLPPPSQTHWDGFRRRSCRKLPIEDLQYTEFDFCMKSSVPPLFLGGSGI